MGPGDYQAPRQVSKPRDDDEGDLFSFALPGVCDVGVVGHHHHQAALRVVDAAEHEVALRALRVVPARARLGIAAAVDLEMGAGAVEGPRALAVAGAVTFVIGSLLLFGVLQMATIAGELEHLENDYSTVAPELLRSLEDEFERVKEILNAERQRRSA